MEETAAPADARALGPETAAPCNRRPAASAKGVGMGTRLAVVLYVVAMVAAIVGVDLAFLRHQFWARLIVNIGIVLVFAAFYLRFLGRP